jgi:hypothetical protein
MECGCDFGYLALGNHGITEFPARRQCEGRNPANSSYNRNGLLRSAANDSFGEPNHY